MDQRSDNSQKVLSAFQLAEGDPLYQENRLLSDFILENQRPMLKTHWEIHFDATEPGKEILALKPKQKVQLIQAILPHLDYLDEWAAEIRPNIKWYNQELHDVWEPWLLLAMVLLFCLKGKLPFQGPEIEHLLKLINRPNSKGAWSLPKDEILLAVLRFAKNNPINESLKSEIKEYLFQSRALDGYLPVKSVESQLRQLIGLAPALPLQRGEAWSDMVIEELESLDEADFKTWSALLWHCSAIGSGMPTAKWSREADKWVDQIGKEQFEETILRWFPRVDSPESDFFTSTSDILKGLVCCCRDSRAPELIRCLSQLAVSAYKKIPGIGPRMVKVGNACVSVLGQLPGLEPVAQLALLKVRVKFGSALREIEKSLTAAAEREGVSRDELEEMAVPAYGLTEVGRLQEQLGDFTAELVVEAGKPQLRWIKPDGKPQKTVPAAVKRDFAEDLKDLKQAAKDIEKMLPAQSARIEQAYLQQKEWDFPIWRERYLDHPLVGTVARRLIWVLRTDNSTTSAIFDDGQFVLADGTPTDDFGESTKVRLWHPLDESTDEIVAWRNWLIDHEVRQPFKQAHREVYLLTDAERNTEVYSNRFAAHVIKQHQFNALCAARGWKNSLRLMVDDSAPPAHLILPSWGLRAEFWVEGAGDEYGVDTNETGTFLYLVTDQVRFYRDDAAMNWAHVGGGGYQSSGLDETENHPLRLEEIPPLVFSEVMRDVDLFVGVASAGNDPNWNDGGPAGRYRDYWQSYSFGELGNSARTRKETLQRLIPRLKVAERCSFTDRFLIVKGDVRTYKIHLGSGNILMEPSDEYLCIVPGQSLNSKSDKVFLPFEGDRTLSIILSKALLLADDKKIRDSTILSQIEMR